ncbi:hypothetical protein BT67DRAFT_432882 [Trichocladium antarcticum]|uniref:Uncharacterized protein n=1 Tax=Trichocladium antarcticum TaxID=1450529 RepID=A0AAN6ZFT4_9PEZI|nr:hypothetical protein BT67DRAFT_432882 [Trichocladium antarcticum]
MAAVGSATTPEKPQHSPLTGGSEAADAAGTMSPTSHPPNLIEYVWPCGHHENVAVQEAPGIAFVRGQFSLPVAKPPEEFTEKERKGVPGRRKCCRCWATCSLFKPLEACEECDHPFDGCAACMIVDSSGSREIATLQRRPVAEFDQTPEYWRCSACERINGFDNESGFNGFLAPKVADYMEDLRCRQCSESFHEDSWVVNPFSVYLGTWNGRAVAEGGPWHWNLEWHRDFAGEDHSKDDCYSTRKNGRRRRENPCTNKHPEPAPESAARGGFVIPALVIDTSPDDHSLPPPSAGLTPFPEDHAYDSESDVEDAQQSPRSLLAPDNQTPASAGFTIGDYHDDQHEPDLGSYYDAPAADEDLPDEAPPRSPDRDTLAEAYDDLQRALDGAYELPLGEDPLDSHGGDSPAVDAESYGQDFDQPLGEDFAGSELGDDDDDLEDSEEDEDEHDPDLPPFPDNGHVVVAKNNYAVLDTPAAVAHAPPGMGHDLLWNDTDEEGDVSAEQAEGEGGFLDGEEGLAEGEGGEPLDGEDGERDFGREGFEEEGLLPEEELLGEYLPEDGEFPPEGEGEFLPEGEFAEGEEMQGEYADGEYPADEMPDGEFAQGEFPQQEYPAGDFPEDGERGFGDDFGGEQPPGEYAEDGYDGVDGVGESYDAPADGGYSQDDYAEAEYPQDQSAEGGYVDDGQPYDAPADGGYPQDQFAEGGYVDGGQTYNTPADSGYPQDDYAAPEYTQDESAEGGYVDDGQPYDAPADGGFVDGEYPPDEFAAAADPEGEMVADGFAEGQPDEQPDEFVDDQLAYGEFTDGQPGDSDVLDGEFAEGELGEGQPLDGEPFDGEPVVEFSEDVGDGERGLDEEFVDGELVDEGPVEEGALGGEEFPEEPVDELADGGLIDGAPMDGEMHGQEPADGEFAEDAFDGPPLEEEPPFEEEQTFEEELPLDETPFEDQPFEDHAFDEAPLGEQPFGDAPLDDQTGFGDQPFEESRGFDESAAFDDEGEFQDTQPYDDPAPYDDPSPYDEPAPDAEPASYNEPASYDDPALYDDPAPNDDPAPYNEPAPFDEPAPYEEPAPFEEPAPSEDAPLEGPLFEEPLYEEEQAVDYQPEHDVDALLLEMPPFEEGSEEEPLPEDMPLAESSEEAAMDEMPAEEERSFEEALLGEDNFDEPLEEDAMEEPSAEEERFMEGTPLEEEPFDETQMDEPYPSDSFDDQNIDGGYDGGPQQFDEPGQFDETQQFDEQGHDDFQDPQPDEFEEEMPLSPALPPQDYDDQELIMSPTAPPTPPLDEENDDYPMSPAPQYDGSEYGPPTPPLDEDVPPLPSPPMHGDGAFDERGDSVDDQHPDQDSAEPPFEEQQSFDEPPPNEQQFEEPLYEEQPLEEQSFDEGPLNEQQFEEPLYEEQPFDEGPLDEQQFEEPLYEEQPLEEQFEDPSFNDAPPDEQPFEEQPFDEGPLDEQRFEEPPDEEHPFDEQPFDDGPLDEQPFEGQPFEDDFDSRDGGAMYGEQGMAPLEEPYQEQPFDEQPFDEQPFQEQLVEEQPFEDNLNPQDAYRDSPQPFDEQGFAADEGHKFEDDRLPEFPAPDSQEEFGADPSRSPMQDRPPQEPQYSDYPYEAPQEVYYDPDDAEPHQPMDNYRDSQVPYQANGPMEITPGGGVAARHKSAKHKDKKYQWLLPLMSTATLGWGIEAVEEQYHAGVARASAFGFKGWAGKLFGSKKGKDDPDAATADRSEALAAGVATDENGMPLDETRNDLHDPANVDPNGDWEDVPEHEPDDKKKTKRGLWGLFHKKKGGDLETQDQELPGDQNAGDPNMDPNMDPILNPNGYPYAEPGTEQPKKKGFFGTLFGKKKPKQQDLEAGDPNMQPQDSMDRGMGQDMNGEGFDNAPMDDSQDGATQPPKKGGFFANLFGKKTKSRGRGMNDTQGHRQRTKKTGLFAGLFGSKKRNTRRGEQHDTILDSNGMDHHEQHSPRPKKGGFFTRVFSSGKKSKSRDLDRNGEPIEQYPLEQYPLEQYPAEQYPAEQYPSEESTRPNDNMNTGLQNAQNKPAKKPGFFARLFGSGKKSKRVKRDKNAAAAWQYPADEQYPPGNSQNMRPKDNMGPGGQETFNGPSKKKPGFFARLFSNNKAKSSQDAAPQPAKKHGMLARSRTANHQDAAQTAPTQTPTKPGFFFGRLLGRKPNKTNNDIEMGRMRQGHSPNPSAHMGSVNAGGPRLVHDDGTNKQQSAVADLLDDGQYEDVHPDDGTSKKARRKQAKAAKTKTKTTTKKKNSKEPKDLHHGLGLYRRAIGKKDGAAAVSQPQAARKRPGRVRYAPIAPSDGMHQHVSAPKALAEGRGGGGARTAAANPGNWFWMDVYWK